MNLRRLSATSFGHFSIDVLNSSVAIILTAMAGRFDLSNSQIAFGVMFYTFAAALTQPLFGILADRLRGRWLASAGLLWTMLFYIAAASATTYGMLLTLLTIGALGSAAFHPVGTMTATDAGRDKATSATSIFFLFGQSGLALGPVIVGYVLQQWGMGGLPYVALGTVPAFLMMALWLRKPIEQDEDGPEATEQEATKREATQQQGSRSIAKQSSAPASRQNNVRKQQMAIGGLALAAFVALIALRATTVQSFISLLPKFLADQGYSSAEYGRMIGAFSLAGAFGTLTGGFLGDRYSRRKVVFWACLAAAPMSFFMLNASGMNYSGMNYYLLAIGSGFMLSLPHSIIVVMAQRLLPRNQGLASGAVLGLMFASGAATSGLVGYISDFTGLGIALHTVALLPILAGICALTLPTTRTPKIVKISKPIAAGAAGND